VYEVCDFQIDAQTGNNGRLGREARKQL
jgi:hypothetical protein